MLAEIFRPFVEQAAPSVMVRGALERLLSPKWVDEAFERLADRQYTRELLFSSLFGLMVRVVIGQAKSIRWAYRMTAEQIGVSLTSVYNKLNGIAPETSAGLVREAGHACAEAIDAMGGGRRALLPGFAIRILDGNCLAATEHRIRELRRSAAGALPGKSLVVYDPDRGCVLDVVACADGYTQERALLTEIVSRVAPGEVWVADRNFCTRGFVCDVVARGGHVVLREHKNVPVTEESGVRFVGKCETGGVFEQDVSLSSEDGASTVRLRRVRLALKSKTRDGDSILDLLTSLPSEQVGAVKVANLYRKRWTIETAFQELERDLRSEIRTLGYPGAALFGFCVALIAYDVMALVYAALRAEHGAERIDEQFSHYYLAGDLELTHVGMMIALPAEHWRAFADMSPERFVAALLWLASHIDLKRYAKARRGPKKVPPLRKSDPATPHVSTARLLSRRKK